MSISPPRSSLRTVVIRTQEHAEQVVHAVARYLTHYAEVQAAAHDILTRVQGNADRRLRRILRQATRLSTGLKVYAEGERATLTEQGLRKSHHFDNAQIRWLTTPPAVIFLKPEKDIVAELKRRHLKKRFVRTSESVNKEALLAMEHRAVVRKLEKFLRLEQRERFVIDFEPLGMRFVWDPSLVEEDSWTVEKKKLKKKL